MADLYNLPNNTTSLDQIIIDTVETAPFLTPLLLLFTFFVIFLGGIARQKQRIGTADYAMWSVIGSLGTMMVALIMSVTTGMIRLDWLVIVVVLTIFSGVWLFLDRKSSEI